MPSRVGTPSDAGGFGPSQTLPSPPDIPGLVWRRANPLDLPSIRRLQSACAAAYDTPTADLTEYAPALGEQEAPPAGDTICAVDPVGDVVAIGWVRLNPEDRTERRINLFGDVHPEHRRRGLGTFVLEWTEARGRELAAAQPRSYADLLRIDFSDRRGDALPLFERRGFRLGFHELRMRRDLSRAIPTRPVPQGIEMARFAPEIREPLVEVYNDAYSTYWPPGHPRLTVDYWMDEFERDPDFRADLTLLAMEGTEGVGFVVGNAGGWVAQIGVRPPWRGLGVADALLGEVLRAFRAQGERHAELAVRAENSAARRLYERMGFEPVGHRVMYCKDM